MENQTNGTKDQLYVGIDFGTSMLKASVIRSDGFLVRDVSIPRMIDSGGLGTGDVISLCDPERVWLSELRQVCRLVVNDTDDSKIGAIAISGTVPDVWCG